VWSCRTQDHTDRTPFVLRWTSIQGSLAAAVDHDAITVSSFPTSRASAGTCVRFAEV